MNQTNQDISFLYSFYKNMKEHDIVMMYQGEFSQDVTKSVLSVTENTFNTGDIDETVKKKVYNIMIEVLQNICKHELKTETDSIANAESMFLISSTPTEFHIITGNAIDKTLIEIIKSKIDRINTLDAEGLKALYKEARLNSTISAVGGAGLGFIDIARKSGNKIQYHFAPLTDSVFYFTQLVTVTK